ncbi:MAG: TIGR03619 family F420-dependent LLM class oxidoreductase [Gammaproteobacteria bacterium]|nr:TIGR03619 family F420-dependent LLM class oxidoreductase [Gammaproteobacteria bacterium]
MRLGFSLPNNQGTERVADLAQLAHDAEELGYHSVWVSEHLWHSSYVEKRLGCRPYHDPLTVLTAAAMATRSVRLGTSVLVLPWHHPVRLAKTLASLDDLSEGRVDMGVGVAVTEDEFANLGVDFTTRGRQTDDALAAIKALWTEEFPEHQGEFYRFAGMRFEPKPRQRPHPPILIGGGVPAALRRVVRFGDGWHALGQSPDMMLASMARLGEECAQAGRNVADLHISIRCVIDIVDSPWDRPVTQRKTLKGTAEEIAATIAAFAAAGVQEIVIDANNTDLEATRAVMRRAIEFQGG